MRYLFLMLNRIFDSFASLTFDISDSRLKTNLIFPAHSCIIVHTVICLLLLFYIFMDGPLLIIVFKSCVLPAPLCPNRFFYRQMVFLRCYEPVLIKLCGCFWFNLLATKNTKPAIFSTIYFTIFELLKISVFILSNLEVCIILP